MLKNFPLSCSFRIEKIMLKEARDDDTIKNKYNTVLHDLRSKIGKNSKLNAGNINLFFPVSERLLYLVIMNLIEIVVSCKGINIF